MIYCNKFSPLAMGALYMPKVCLKFTNNPLGELRWGWFLFFIPISPVLSVRGYHLFGWKPSHLTPRLLGVQTVQWSRLDHAFPGVWIAIYLRRGPLQTDPLGTMPHHQHNLLQHELLYKTHPVYRIKSLPTETGVFSIVIIDGNYLCYVWTLFTRNITMRIICQGAYQCFPPRNQSFPMIGCVLGFYDDTQIASIWQIPAPYHLPAKSWP